MAHVFILEDQSKVVLLSRQSAILRFNPNLTLPSRFWPRNVFRVCVVGALRGGFVLPGPTNEREGNILNWWGVTIREKRRTMEKANVSKFRGL